MQDKDNTTSDGVQKPDSEDTQEQQIRSQDLPIQTVGRRKFLSGAAGVAATSGLANQMSGETLIATDSSSQTAAPEDAPNIVVIMADDLGYSDLGCYGSAIDTPNLDSLADEGLRFTDFSNCSRCCPTRASVLTGVYPHQAGVGRMTFDEDKEGYQGQLTDDVVTIAEALGSQGYNTAMTGKWHLSLTRTPNSNHMEYLNNQKIRDRFAPNTQSYPIGRGFDDHYGPIWGVVNYFDPFSLVDGTDSVESVPDDYYISDAITDRSIEYVDKHASGDDPMFLYTSYTAPHWPLHAPQETIDKYIGQFDDGWQATREERYQRMVDERLINPNTAPLSERIDSGTSWQEADNKEFRAQRMAVHAAMIDRMDQGIGRIIDKLDSMGELENTLILFLSDNGASPEQLNSSGFDRPSETREGESIDYLSDFDPLPGPETTFEMIGHRWSNVSNTPWRYWKKEQYAGGVRTPLIAHWPKELDVELGSITHEPGHVIDIMATCLDAAGLDYPDEYNGTELVPMEGRSLMPMFKGNEREGHEAIFYEHFGAAGVRKGAWKLVRRGQKDSWSLYNIAKDETETTDLASKHPGRVEKLEQLWYDWAISHSVFPMPGHEGLIDADLAPHNPSTFTGTAWRWHRGDDMAWKEPEFDDTSWAQVDVPFDWTEEADPPYTEDQAFGWFRRTITIPQEWDTSDLNEIMLPLGKIDSADETYLNGTKIGKTGQFPEDKHGFQAAFSIQRNYSIPKEMVNFGEKNVIAVRVYKKAYSGGIIGGQIGPLSRLMKDEQSSVAGISNGLATLYEFNGTKFDSVGGEPSETDIDGLYGNAQFSTESIEGSHCVELDGTEDYILLADFGDGESFQHDSFTQKSISMWVKPDATSGIQNLYNEGGTVNGIAVRINDGTIEAGVANNSNRTVISNTFDQTDWTHVAVVFEEGAMTLYLDGKEVAMNSDVGNETIPSHVAGTELGGSTTTDIWGTDKAFLKGKIDVTALYSRALSPEEIMRLSSTFV